MPHARLPNYPAPRQARTQELVLVGIAAAAPATHLVALFRDDLGTSGANNLAALALSAWERAYEASYVTIVAPQAQGAVATIADNVPTATTQAHDYMDFFVSGAECVRQARLTTEPTEVDQ